MKIRKQTRKNQELKHPGVPIMQVLLYFVWPTKRHEGHKSMVLR